LCYCSFFQILPSEKSVLTTPKKNPIKFTMLKFCAVLLIAATCILSQPIPPAPIELVWEGMYPPPYLTSPQAVMSMDCVSKNLCYLGGMESGPGAVVAQYNGKMNGQLTFMNMPNQSAMVFSIAVSGTEAKPTGVFTSVDLMANMESKGLQYLSDGNTWLASLMPLDFIWEGPSVTKYQSNSNTFVAVGNGIPNQIMLSTDAGVAFIGENINYHVDEYNCSAPGAIAALSDAVWYMTWGAEPPQNNSGSSSSSMGNAGVSSSSDVNSKYLEKNEHIIATKQSGKILVIYNFKTETIRVHHKTIRQWREDKIIVQKSNPVCNYYKGAILKSTDQGKTWHKVFEHPSMTADFISCYDEQHCTVMFYSPNECAAVTTQDGINWRVAYQTPAPTQTAQYVLQNVGYANQNTIWLGGGKASQTSDSGFFWYSNDAGVTFTPYQHSIPDLDSILSISCPEDDVCFASALSLFKTTQILRYKKQADYGNFIQSNCALQKCELCSNTSFQQDFCLQTQGGSAKAICTPQGLTQYIYQTTSCVGSYTTSTMPVNVCLNSTQGGYFENYCPNQQGYSESGARKHTKRDSFKHI
jgi:hypothetical protein